MTPRETIQAAITELTRLKEASTKGKWKVIADDEESNICPVPTEGIFWGTQPQAEGVILWGEYADSRDTNLVVALHRTIDAQLAILQEGHQVCVNLDEIGLTGNPGRARPAFDLARAILGETA